MYNDVDTPVRTLPQTTPITEPYTRPQPDWYCPNQGDEVVRKLS